MLILQRRAGESLHIGEDIEISIVSVDGGRVRIAISAPAEVPILRSELVNARAANRDAAMAQEAEPIELLHILEEVVLPIDPTHSAEPLHHATLHVSALQTAAQHHSIDTGHEPSKEERT